ncbi:hypothetical protein [Streptomyces sp. SAS_270]|uniref:hypothetical protein n=1 Tax=Streptomyces sp. SAS_270 TaxID=3412748 RepID=UPI00403C15B1
MDYTSSAHGRDTPLKVITVDVNVNDVIRTWSTASRPRPSVPAGHAGAPDSLFGDKGYDSTPPPPRAAQVPDPAGHLPQARSEYQGRPVVGLRSHLLKAATDPGVRIIQPFIQTWDGFFKRDEYFANGAETVHVMKPCSKRTRK